jgi:uncharacterized surface protein with fasciclin (FAS1) repeats
MLSSDETYTLFAPTNAAFTAAGISAKTDKVILNDILRNQIAATKVSATNKGNVKTLEGFLGAFHKGIPKETGSKCHARGHETGALQKLSSRDCHGRSPPI